jgi:beta-glucosidase-like glycosyl hydrolase
MTEGTESSESGKSLSVNQKAGRVLFIGLPGTRLDARTTALLREVQPGGVAIFGRNIETPEQLALLNAEIRDAVDVQCSPPNAIADLVFNEDDVCHRADVGTPRPRESPSRPRGRC